MEAIKVSGALLERLRRFLQTHNVGYDPALLEGIYPPLHARLKEGGVPVCDAEFESCKRITFADRKASLQLELEVNRKQVANQATTIRQLQEERDELRRVLERLRGHMRLVESVSSESKHQINEALGS